MASYNKVILMGNLTRDPQLSYLPSQTAAVDIGLAVNHKYKGNDGQMVDKVCFIDCRAYGRQAEISISILVRGGRFSLRVVLSLTSGKRRTDLNAASIACSSNGLRLLTAGVVAVSPVRVVGTFLPSSSNHSNNHRSNHSNNHRSRKKLMSVTQMIRSNCYADLRLCM